MVAAVTAGARSSHPLPSRPLANGLARSSWGSSPIFRRRAAVCAWQKPNPSFRPRRGATSAIPLPIMPAFSSTQGYGIPCYDVL